MPTIMIDGAERMGSPQAHVKLIALGHIHHERFKMSDLAASLFKALSALTSPKAAIKYISVVLFFLLSWQYVNPIVADLNVPPQYTDILAILLGFGLGALIGEVIWAIIIFCKNLFVKRRLRLKFENEKLVKEAARAQIMEQKKKEKFEGFKKAYSHFLPGARERMRSLISGEQCWDSAAPEIVDLEVQGYIVKAAKVDQHRSLYQMSPLLVDYVRDQWAEEVDRNVNEFFGAMSSSKEMLLKIMDGSFDSSENVSRNAFSDQQDSILQCFRYSYGVSGLSITFREQYKHAFKKRTGQNFSGSAFIPDARIT